jgi:hypothetical protein
MAWGGGLEIVRQSKIIFVNRQLPGHYALAASYPRHAAVDKSRDGNHWLAGTVVWQNGENGKMGSETNAINRGIVVTRLTHKKRRAFQPALITVPFRRTFAVHSALFFQQAWSV